MKPNKSLTVLAVVIALVASWIMPAWGCSKNQGKGTGRPDTLSASAAQPAKDTGLLQWLALGDSYTIGQSVPESERYPVQAAGLLKTAGIDIAGPEIVALTGWTTQNLLDAIKNKTAPPYAIVTLLIGVNNQYQGRSPDEYREQFARLLARSIQLTGNRPGRVIVLSIPDYSVTPFAAGYDRAAIARGIDAFNATNKDLSNQYNVQWMDITEASRMAAGDASLVAADSLHFSGKEYAVWAGMLAPRIKQALQ
jgi:lysophospholipase L1-like esterase